MATGKTFGLLVASALTTVLATGARADDKPTGTATKAAAGGKCVHDCNGHADCKGNGNNECKGKNSCANTGLVPKKCSRHTDEKSCRAEPVDKNKNAVCTWMPA